VKSKTAAILSIFLTSAYLTTGAVCAAATESLFGNDEMPTLANVVEKVQKGIVNISAVGGSRYSREMDDLSELFRQDDFFRRFFNLDHRRQRRSLDLGSGVIINAENGFVLTNHHVLENAAEIHVTLSDGRVSVAEVIGSDPAMDLALLKIDEEDLHEVELGNSDTLRVGDFVLAIGNNFGLSATVTSGIVSALGRSGLQMDQYQEFIQTDAAINPGSSGGALVNLNAEVIGINTAILSPGGGNIGIAFAIPINTASIVAEQLIQFGRVERGVLGIHFQEITEELAKAFNYGKIEGVVVTRVRPDSAAEQAGLQEGDILTHINGKKIIDGSHLRTMIALIRVGGETQVKYVRDGSEIQSSGIIGRAALHTLNGETIDERLSGAQFSNIESSSDEDAKGIVVTSVAFGSPAWSAGVRESDLILEVNRLKIKNVEQFVEAVAAVQDSEQLLALKINREGDNRYVVLG